MKTKLTKQTKIIIAVMLVLLIACLILLFLSREGILKGRVAQQNATISFFDQQNTKVLEGDWLLSLPAITFDATIRSGGRQAEDAKYVGVELNTLLEQANISLIGKESLVFYAADSYVVTVKVEELTDRDNFYIVYQKNGKPLKNKADGGEGPYQLVIKDDAFSQRWCKYLAEVEIR